ncbi:PaaI family thioesterase [Frankia sp. Cppng1_Ct_nod]|uniref:PaaI family thioesterase n=1 Tax=Frankia sp. Cppng1_Ct_nod TaxID=2897162 RepID=UPI002023EFB1|nr:PaaI family thioesterase [Frankia sp. Cppng1_Ct_nod]
MTTTEPRPPDVTWGEPRSKTLVWHDPMAIAAVGKTMTGRDFLLAMRDGAVPPPPIAAHFDFRIGHVGDGDVVFGCAPDESAYNPIGVVHGGLVCTLLDTVTGCSVHTALPAGFGYTSIEIKVNYLRPVRVIDGRPSELTAHGWVVRPGRRIVFAEGDVRDVDGRIVATASSTCLVFPLDGEEHPSAGVVRDVLTS